MCYRSLEAQRALLGCYYLSTHGLNVFGMSRVPSYLYRPYYSKCATNLQSAEQYPQDGCLESMVDLLRIVERIHSWRAMAAGSTRHTLGLSTSFTNNILQELQAWSDKHLGSTGRRTYHLPGKAVRAQLHCFDTENAVQVG